MAESEILARVKTIYEEKRNYAENERKHKISEINKKYPEIEQIEKEFSELGMANLKRIAVEPEKAAEFNRELKLKFSELTHMKNSLLKKYSIPKNYKELRFECSKCSDTGYTPDGKRCKCFEQSIIDEVFGNKTHFETLKRENFGSFNLEYYPEETESTRPRDAAKKAAGRAKRLCENFDNETNGLIFIGEPGLGKSFLSNCIEGNLRRRGKTVLSVRAVQLFKLMEDYKFCREEDYEHIRYIYESDLLIIDDLGTENNSQLNSSFFDEIINDRILRGKKTVISTNYSLEELRNRYSTRFISRLAEYFIVSFLYGSDIRMQIL